MARIARIKRGDEFRRHGDGIHVTVVGFKRKPEKRVRIRSHETGRVSSVKESQFSKSYGPVRRGTQYW